MRLTDDKINHLAHLVTKELSRDDSISFKKETNSIRLAIKQIITRELQTEEEVDRIVRKMLNSYAKKPIEGSTEWEVMYNKLYEEQMAKRRKISRLK